MADLTSLGDAQVVLLAVQLASDAEVERFHQLAARRPDVLNADIIYRILYTYLPVDSSISQLISLLEGVRCGHLQHQSFDNPIDLSSFGDLNALTAQKRISRLQFKYPTRVSESPLTCFLIARAYQNEAANGDLPAILQLVNPFIEHDEFLRTWVSSKLLPLLRLQYEYYPEKVGFPTLGEIERLSGSTGISKLLQHTSNEHSGRDLRGVVGPWVHGESSAKRRKIAQAPLTPSTHWRDVNEWILSRGAEDFALVASAINDWSGPRDIDLGGYQNPEIPIDEDIQEDNRKYQQTALAVIYASDEVTQDVIARSGAVLERAANLAGLLPPDRFRIMPLVEELPSEFGSITRASLLHHALLQSDNILTRPSSSAISLIEALLASLRILKTFKIDMSVRAAAEICLFGNEDQQKRELSRVLDQIPRLTSIDIDWQATHTKLLYMKSWTGSQVDHDGPHGLFWRIPVVHLYEELLKTMLKSNAYDSAIEIFLTTKTAPLPMSTVETCVQAAIFNAYDNASNGNRTRGGVKRAYDLLNAFLTNFPESVGLRQIVHLIAATHSLSFYQLTLQHGVPFQPVSIRVHKDPLSLIDRVLEQNSRSYTKLDDLQGIGVNIVLAGLPANHEYDDADKSQQTRLQEAEQRITLAAVTSALAQHDFDTAYSYIMTRLSGQQRGTVNDDTSWRAAYAAGRYRPPPITQSSASIMANLSKRMDLLSLALTLCSSLDHLPEILDVWQKCEEEMNHLKMKDAEQERAWAEKSNRFSQSTIPGAFGDLQDRDADIADTERAIATRSAGFRSTGAYEDEAPKGIFDVARGAAAAIQKSAFPLRSPVQRQFSINSSGARSAGSFDDQREDSIVKGNSERVRKRDMVSNAVTGSLIKGMSWALGAEPLVQHNDED